MIVKVERCTSGKPDMYIFRMTLPKGQRESVIGSAWTKTLAAEALDRLASLYHLPRHSIRFHHAN